MIGEEKSITGSTIYSHFKHLCPYHTWLLFNIKVQEEIPSPAERLLMESGISHEEQALIYFQNEFGDECFVVSGEDGLGEKENIRIKLEQTLKAMEEGKKVIYHGILEREAREIKPWGKDLKKTIRIRGETDFLFRMENKGDSRSGNHHYEVGDAKSSRSSKFCQQMQVVFYSWLLEPVQSMMPQCGRILTRPLGIEKESAPFREELFLIDDYIWTLKSFLEEEFQEIMAKEENEFFFHPIRSCETCLYYDYCLERATAVNDLSLLPDTRKIQKRRLNGEGIFDIEALAGAQDSILKVAGKKSGVTFGGLEKLRLQAQSIVKNEPVPRGLFESPREACLAMTEIERDLTGEREEGITSIDFADRSLVHVYFDMESDPYSSVEYLFGIAVDEPGKGGRRKKGRAEFFTSHSYSPDDEYGAFCSFLERMDQIRNEYGDEGFVIFHYAHYEPNHLIKLAEKYQEQDPGLVDKVDYLTTRMVDLYKLIRKTYYLPVSSYSIKDVAPCIKTIMGNRGRSGGHEWKKIKTLEELKKELRKGGWSKTEISESIVEVQEVMKRFDLTEEASIFDASAEMSVVWFNLFIERKKRVWMKLIEIYNEDDLKATRALVDWLLYMQRRKGW